MSQPSNWPLPANGTRLLTPAFIRSALAHHPLSSDCFPTSMGFYPVAHGHFMSRTHHDDNLLMLCVSGRGIIEAEGRSQHIRPGDVLLLPRGRSHYYRAHYEDPWSVYWAHFSGNLAATLMQLLGADQLLSIHPGLIPRLVAGFQHLLEVERTGYDLNAYIEASSQLRHLLVELVVLKDQSARSSRSDLDVDALQQYMREQVHTQLTLDDLAGLAGVSRSHFAQRYRALTGYAPIRHFTHLKMEAACRLLDSGDQSIKQVAAALGYEDPLYFSRVFRRIVGVSPRGYRQSVTA